MTLIPVGDRIAPTSVVQPLMKLQADPIYLSQSPPVDVLSDNDGDRIPELPPRRETKQIKQSRQRKSNVRSFLKGGSDLVTAGTSTRKRKLAGHSKSSIPKKAAPSTKGKSRRIARPSNAASARSKRQSRAPAISDVESFADSSDEEDDPVHHNENNRPVISSEGSNSWLQEYGQRLSDYILDACDKAMGEYPLRSSTGLPNDQERIDQIKHLLDMAVFLELCDCLEFKPSADPRQRELEDWAITHGRKHKEDFDPDAEIKILIPGEDQSRFQRAVGRLASEAHSWLCKMFASKELRGRTNPAVSSNVNLQQTAEERRSISLQDFNDRDLSEDRAALSSTRKWSPMLSYRAPKRGKRLDLDVRCGWREKTKQNTPVEWSFRSHVGTFTDLSLEVLSTQRRGGKRNRRSSIQRLKSEALAKMKARRNGEDTPHSAIDPSGSSSSDESKALYDDTSDEGDDSPIRRRRRKVPMDCFIVHENEKIHDSRSVGIPEHLTWRANRSNQEYFREAVEWIIQCLLDPDQAAEEWDSDETSKKHIQLSFYKIERFVSGFRDSVYDSDTWKTSPTFLPTLLARPCATSEKIEVRDQNSNCEACNNISKPATWIMSFHGHPYDCESITFFDPDSLGTMSDDEDRADEIADAGRKYYLGQHCHEKAVIRHRLLHWKLNLKLTVERHLEAEDYLSEKKREMMKKLSKEGKGDFVEEVIVRLRRSRFIDREWNKFDRYVSEVKTVQGTAKAGIVGRF